MHSVRDPRDEPTWCTGSQCHEPDSRDRYHERLGPVVSAVLRQVKRAHGDAVVSAEAGELRAALFTSAVEPDEVWLAIDLGEHGAGITVSAESMRRLLPSLIDLLEVAGR